MKCVHVFQMRASDVEYEMNEEQKGKWLETKEAIPGSWDVTLTAEAVDFVPAGFTVGLDGQVSSNPTLHEYLKKAVAKQIILGECTVDQTRPLAPEAGAVLLREAVLYRDMARKEREEAEARSAADRLAREAERQQYATHRARSLLVMDDAAFASEVLSDNRMMILGTPLGDDPDSVAVRSRAEAMVKQAKDAENTERLDWITKFGSPRLQRMVHEGIEYENTYLDERLETDRPGWRYDGDTPGRDLEPRNVKEHAFTLLDEARKTDDQAKLVWWVWDDKESGERVYAGYAAVGSYLGYKTVFLDAEARHGLEARGY